MPENGAHMEDKRRECGADNAGPAACGALQTMVCRVWCEGCRGGPVNFNILEKMRTAKFRTPG